jgi:predicted SAM-dependent methyltransferase
MGIRETLRPWLRRHPQLFAATRSALYAARSTYGHLVGSLLGPAQWRRYCSTYPVRKLHLGCGDLFFPGWLNTDGFPRRRDVAFCDVTGTFPFPDNSFDFIFTEHMIEHIDYVRAEKMIAECFRTLKPGGVLRVSTPDLDRILALRDPQTDLARDYLAFALSEIPEAKGQQPAFVINNFVRSWGHTFIYDRPTMAQLLATAGFTAIRPYEAGESDIPELRGIERHGETLPRREFNLVESMVFEATKT